MQINVEVKEDFAVLKIAGSMIFDESLFRLRDRIQELLQSGVCRLVVDVSEVPHLDSSGCGEVIRTYTSVVKADGAVAFVNPTERVRMLWTRIKILGILAIFQTIEEAERFVRKDRERKMGS
jgi:anti-anti-sigma factor